MLATEWVSLQQNPSSISINGYTQWGGGGGDGPLQFLDNGATKLKAITSTYSSISAYFIFNSCVDYSALFQLGWGTSENSDYPNQTKWRQSLLEEGTLDRFL